jgi:hypothetical protein
MKFKICIIVMSKSITRNKTLVSLGNTKYIVKMD